MAEFNNTFRTCAISFYPLWAVTLNWLWSPNITGDKMSLGSTTYRVSKKKKIEIWDRYMWIYKIDFKLILPICAQFVGIKSNFHRNLTRNIHAIVIFIDISSTGLVTGFLRLQKEAENRAYYFFRSLWYLVLQVTTRDVYRKPKCWYTEKYADTESVFDFSS